MTLEWCLEIPRIGSLQTFNSARLQFHLWTVVQNLPHLLPLLSIDVPKVVTPFGTLASAISDEAQHSLTKSGVYETAVLIKIGRRILGKRKGPGKLMPS
jgi:hypothetical protein